ncbi:NAD-dependent epimerase/dehydratase family protein [Amnibacterium setariae]|uniref:NAD-dependent epimerase/dehydratase family protein n=1 Tax=Amnibacterium setariae TaxID=2306585 RepID=A0A3A1TX58_9MICO|nr:NAD-dependent epimerase/dehydratase family protein [Amnibacterium setariae]RIX28360.1 NAD-dependent epimerase/dehydratase family protein [Amnibacterium setariae]
MSRVLVTGASGWLGAAVARDLVAAGYEVRTLQRRPSGVDGAEDVLGSVMERSSVERAVEGVEGVVHLAAKVSFAGDEADFVAVNIEGTRALVRAAKRAGARRFVFVSSPSVAHTGAAIMGEDAPPAQPERAHGAYARTKAAAELVALGADAPGFAVVAVRPHIVWGPGDPQLVARIQERAAAGRLPLVGSGAALVDSTYLDDAVSGIRAALDAADRVHGNAYVLTSGEPRPIAELIGGFCAAAGIAPPARRVPAGAAKAAGSVVEAVWRVRPGQDEPPMTRFLAEQLSTAHWFDLRRTRRDLGWRPEVGVTEGLRRLAEHHAAG